MSMLKPSPICQSCGADFEPKRAWQHFCSRGCSNRHAQQHARAEKCADTKPTLCPIPEMRLQPVLTHPGVSRTAPPPYFNPHGPTPGALQGDDYPIEFDADGDPIMPACLDRRPKPELKLKEAA